MIVKKSKSKLENKAITLPSSGEIYLHDCYSIVEDTLVSLLAECYERNLPSKQKVVITRQFLGRLPKNFDASFDSLEPFLKTRGMIQTVGDLLRTYREFYNEEYTLENEKERIRFKLEILHKQGDGRAGWGFYSACVRYANEEREKQKAFQQGGETAVRELRERKSRAGNNLVIG